jgi:hypothetical protein
MSLICSEPDFNKRLPLNQQLLKQIIDIDCMLVPIYDNGFITYLSPKLNDAHRSDIWYHQFTPQNAWFSK